MAPTPDKALHVELTRSILDSAMRIQVLTFLRLSGKEVGRLLNFWTWPLKDGGIQRLIRNPGAGAGQTVP
jgi:hypothetical protein